VNAESLIYVAGHEGLLGRALVRALRCAGHSRLLLVPRAELDLRRAERVRELFERTRPDYVFVAAARVAGIVANQRWPVEMLRDNLEIELALIEAAAAAECRGLLMFGSSCMYPRIEAVAIRERDLLAGPLEPTSQAYAIAKLAGLELCRAHRRQHCRRFIAMVPATLYGPHDHFGSDRAHVIPALIERMHRAKLRGERSVCVLGTGLARREFLHCDDAARAALLLLGHAVELDLVNVGSGEEIAIRDLAREIARVVGYEGEIEFDAAEPEGPSRKLLDSSQAHALGWRARVSLCDGLASAYQWYLGTAQQGTEARAYT
jgi:GDP-L-fucose synthase